MKKEEPIITDVALADEKLRTEFPWIYLLYGLDKIIKMTERTAEIVPIIRRHMDAIEKKVIQIEEKIKKEKLNNEKEKKD